MMNIPRFDEFVRMKLRESGVNEPAPYPVSAGWGDTYGGVMDDLQRGLEQRQAFIGPKPNTMSPELAEYMLPIRDLFRYAQLWNITGGDSPIAGLFGSSPPSPMTGMQELLDPWNGGR